MVLPHRAVDHYKKHLLSAMLGLSVQNEFDIIVCDTEEWHAHAARFDFFKIIYILEGKGVVAFDDETCDYQKDSWLLLPPGASNQFEPSRKTNIFAVILDSERATSTKRLSANNSGFSKLLRQIETFFLNINFKQGKVVDNPTDRRSSRQLIEQIIHEIHNRPDYFRAIVKNSVFLLIHILARNLKETSRPKDVDSQYKTDQIIRYIKAHINDDKKLKPDHLAAKFLLTKENINEGFLIVTGGSMKEFVLRYKRDLFRSRLLSIDVDTLQTSKIAQRF